LEFGLLRPGHVLGLGAIMDPRGECPYPSAVTVRVESCSARLMVLTRRSLLYLPDQVAARVDEALANAEDPVRLSSEKLRDAQRRTRKWAVTKRTTLRRQMLTVE